jgi:prevent-host-death family protein
MKERPVKVTVNISEAKTHLSRLIERVANGEEIVIAKAGKPVAILSPFMEPLARRTPGNDSGKVILTPEFGEPLREFDEL